MHLINSLPRNSAHRQHHAISQEIKKRVPHNAGPVSAVGLDALAPPEIIAERVNGANEHGRGSAGRRQPRGSIPELGHVAGVLHELVLGLKVVNDQREHKAEHKQNQRPNRVVKRQRQVEHKQVGSVHNQTERGRRRCCC